MYQFKNDEGKKVRLKDFVTMRISFVDTNDEGGYSHFSFPVPKRFMDMVKGKGNMFNGFSFEQDEEHRLYDISEIEIPGWLKNE